jgi:regulator of RNase E activity RraA
LGDEDGVVGIPAALARRVADEATEQEHLGGFLRRVVEAGEPLSEAYPPSPRIRADHEQLRAARDPRGT